MRALFLLTVLGLGMGVLGAEDEQLIERFDGHDSLTTSDFNVPDHWEIRWHSAQTLSIGVIRLDNTVVAGSTGLNSGSLYLPRGGTYRIRVKGEDPIPWDVAIISLGPTPPDASTDSETTPYYVPTPGPEEAPETNTAPAETVTNAPAASETNAAPEVPAPPPVPTQLTEAQQRAIVQVKGDRAQGAGFLIQTASGPAVVTNLSLLADNPRLAITTPAGSDIQLMTLQGAPDRDLAMVGIQNNGYTFLDTATDLPTSVQPGDAVLTAANTSANSSKAATVLTVRADHIELDHFQNHGDPGGPVLQAKSGAAIAVVTAIPPAPAPTDLDKVPFPTRDGVAGTPLSFVALRFDSITNWETYDWKRFANETAFLDAFHQRSRCLDSYLNEKSNDLRPAAKLFLTDEKIKSANDTFLQDSAGGDASQRTDSLRALLFELGIVAGTDMDEIQEPGNFYAFDQPRARDEIAYRNALKAQLDYYSANVNRFNIVARRDN